MADDPNKLVAGTIDQYLIALAHGLQEAQRELNQVLVEGVSGQPIMQYHVPRLDFELKLTCELAQPAPEAAAPPPPPKPGLKPPGLNSSAFTPPTVRSLPKGVPTLRFRPTATGDAARSVTFETVSVIRGSLVAIPANGGRPQALLQLLIERGDGRNLRVTARLKGPASEPLADVEVQFNVDRDGSSPLKPGTDFANAVVVTNADGEATSVLLIDASEPKDTSILVVVDAAARTETLMYRVDR